MPISPALSLSISSPTLASFHFLGPRTCIPFPPKALAPAFSSAWSAPPQLFLRVVYLHHSGLWSMTLGQPHLKRASSSYSIPSPGHLVHNTFATGNYLICWFPNLLSPFSIRIEAPRRQKVDLSYSLLCSQQLALCLVQKNELDNFLLREWIQANLKACEFRMPEFLHQPACSPTLVLTPAHSQVWHTFAQLGPRL